MKSERPVVDVPVSKMEWVLEALTVVLVVFTVATVICYWNKLPETVPIHFGSAGQAKNYAPRTIIGYLTGFNLILYALLTATSFFPHTFNYIWKITSENASRQYLLARQFLRVTKLEVAVLIFFSTWTCIQLAVAPAQSVDSSDLLTLVWILAITIVIYLWRAYLAR